MHFYRIKGFTVGQADFGNRHNSIKRNKAQWFTWQRGISALILACADYLMLILAEEAALWLRNYLMGDGFHIRPVYEYLVVPVVFMAFMFSNRLYTRNMEPAQLLSRLFYSCFWGSAFAIILMFFAHVAGEVSRLFVGLFAIFSFLFILVEKPVLGQFFRFTPWLHVPILIVGAGKSADAAIREFSHTPGLTLNPVGFLDDAAHPESVYTRTIPILGGFKDLEKVVRETGVEDILIAAPGLSQEDLAKMIYRAQSLVPNVGVIPNLVGVPMSNAEVFSFFDEKIMILRVKNNLAISRNRIFKRLFDITATIVGGILVIPVLGLIALWVRLDSPGPAIYHQVRIGRNGKEFKCYKFRSMYVNADEMLQEILAADEKARKEWEEEFKLKNDPRITRSGKFLRKTSLDELPQILNVLKGEMSLVGPRPIVKEEMEKYGANIKDYLMVLPGITGLWQVSGRSDTDYESRVHIDSWYVHNWSIWRDLVILYKTIFVVLSRKGAY